MPVDNPADGGQNVHIVGGNLPLAAGAATATNQASQLTQETAIVAALGGGLPAALQDGATKVEVIGARGSGTGAAWNGATSTSAVALATEWTQSQVVAAGAVRVTAAGNVIRCTTGGTCLATGTGPVGTGSVAEGGASAVVWFCLGVLANGFVLTNNDPSLSFYYDFFSDKAAGGSLPAGQSLGFPGGNPGNVYVWATSGTPAWSCAGMS